MRRSSPSSTTKSNVVHASVVVRSLEVMGDASGAPAVITCDGFAFAFDMLGEVTLRLIGSTSRGTRIQSKIARDLCTHAYVTLLEKQVDATWREANIRMYDDDARSNY